MFPAKKQKLLPLTSIHVEKKDLETELLVLTAESESEFDDNELKDERDFYLEKKQKMPMMQLGPLVDMIDLIRNPSHTKWEYSETHQSSRAGACFDGEDSIARVRARFL